MDATHPDLAGRVLPEIDLLPEVTPLPEQNGHGTRVASLIAGSLNGFGMAGIAPQSTILPVSALDPAGYGDSSTVARAIIAAADAGARVINLSLGGPDQDPVLDQACAYAFARGAIVVAAGGNSYLTGNQIQYPAASPNVLAVASVDRTGNPSGFSNTGPHIDIAAPGEMVLAALPGAVFDEESGTSFAAPQVSATVALVLAVNPSLTAAEAASVVQMNAADDISGNGRDDQLGQGLLRADRAVAAAIDHAALGPAGRLPAAAQALQRDARAGPAREGVDVHRAAAGEVPRPRLASDPGAHRGALRVQAFGCAQVPAGGRRGLGRRRPRHPVRGRPAQWNLANPGAAGRRPLVHVRDGQAAGPSLT